MFQEILVSSLKGELKGVSEDQDYSDEENLIGKKRVISNSEQISSILQKGVSKRPSNGGRMEKKSKSFASDADIMYFAVLDKAIALISKQYPAFDMENILSVLDCCSMNTHHTLEFLTNPSEFEKGDLITKVNSLH